MMKRRRRMKITIVIIVIIIIIIHALVRKSDLIPKYLEFSNAPQIKNEWSTNIMREFSLDFAIVWTKNGKSRCRSSGL
jgi:hypothetical protein